MQATIETESNVVESEIQKFGVGLNQFLKTQEHICNGQVAVIAAKMRAKIATPKTLKEFCDSLLKEDVSEPSIQVSKN